MRFPQAICGQVPEQTRDLHCRSAVCMFKGRMLSSAQYLHDPLPSPPAMEQCLGILLGKLPWQTNQVRHHGFLFCLFHVMQMTIWILPKVRLSEKGKVQLNKRMHAGENGKRESRHSWFERIMTTKHREEDAY